MLLTRGEANSAFFLVALLSWPRCVHCADAGDSKLTYPAPIVVPPSQNWDSNDGPWSSFVVQVGTPPQTLKLLPSTASFQNLVIDPAGCQPGELSDCHTRRGEVFSNNASSTWVANLADPSSNIYDLELESALGYTGKGRYGFDDITLGYIGGGGSTIKNQTLAAVATKSFFMGLLGLTPRTSNFSSFNSPVPSFMQTLQNQSLIPSLSWAYTAGNQYRGQGDEYGSLTLGGYDASKYIRNDLVFPLTVSSGLQVQLQSITSNTSTSLLPSAIDTFIDSTTPYIYLPTEACTLFETAFNLTWNATTELYLLTDTQHSALLASNPSITFTLGLSSSPSSIPITLPYSAFDLTASWPLTTNSTPYFPLKRAANSTQYMLGRTFFQEAYVIADYERANFSVSQRAWNTSTPSNIQAILPPANTTEEAPKRSVTGAAIGGGVGGGVFVLGLVVGVWYWCVRRRRRNEMGEGEGRASPVEVLKPELDGTATAAAALVEAEAPLFGREGKTGYSGNAPAVEMGADAVWPIYEMPAREEVAAEVGGGEQEGQNVSRDRKRGFSWGKGVRG